jgi:cephalosporin-C deacetylase-like acetyl esterase
MILKSPLKYAAYKGLVEGVDVEIARASCDSPFLSHPKLVIEVVRKAAGDHILYRQIRPCILL